MSPEQARGDVETLDRRSDVYSLGLVFFELMTLSHPLDHLRSLEAILTFLREDAIDTFWLKGHFMLAGAPCELADLCAPALERDPAKRYASAEAFLEALQAVVSGKIAVTCHVTFAKRALAESTRWIDRHAMVFSFSFLGGMLAAGYGVYTAALHLVH
jgi:serine/threonine protein kinase